MDQLALFPVVFQDNKEGKEVGTQGSIELKKEKVAFKYFKEVRVQRLEERDWSPLKSTTRVVS